MFSLFHNNQDVMQYVFLIFKHEFVCFESKVTRQQ